MLAGQRREVRERTSLVPKGDGSTRRHYRLSAGFRPWEFNEKRCQRSWRVAIKDLGKCELLTWSTPLTPPGHVLCRHVCAVVCHVMMWRTKLGRKTKLVLRLFNLGISRSALSCCLFLTLQIYLSISIMPVVAGPPAQAGPGGAPSTFDKSMSSTTHSLYIAMHWECSFLH